MVNYLKKMLSDDNGEPNVKLHFGSILMLFFITLIIFNKFNIGEELDIEILNAVWYSALGCLGVGAAERFRKK